MAIPIDTAQSLPFSYPEFSDWFDDHAGKLLNPALENSRRALEQHLDAELPEQQRVRVSVGGRAKSKARTWKKLNDKYVDRVGGLDQVPVVVDDLVGLRIVCTNHSDVDRVIDIVSEMNEFVEGAAPALAVHPATVKDWRKEAKPSGYRAYHVNLCTSVARATEWHVVTCELQIRTLLQEGWGELTHEDTYKPGGSVPPLVSTLSRRMADLMATLDDIADDLRSELDRLSENSLVDGDSNDRPATDVAETAAVRDFLREKVGSLTKPTTLATLAWELQREFGREITDGWFGYGNFKHLLKDAAPDARISTTPPSYVLPAGFDPAAIPSPNAGLPRAVALLREIDRGFPPIASSDWPHLFEAVSRATHDIRGDHVDFRTVNEVARSAREIALDEGWTSVRAHVLYVVRGLRYLQELVADMTDASVRDKFLEGTLPRAEALDLPPAELAELRNWLSGRG